MDTDGLKNEAVRIREELQEMLLEYQEQRQALQSFVARINAKQGELQAVRRLLESEGGRLEFGEE